MQGEAATVNCAVQEERGISGSLQARSVLSPLSRSAFPPGRSNVFKEDDGEAGGPQDPSGDEEDDLGGDRRCQ